MKKTTLFAAMAALALSASAQYTCETPYADQSVVAGETQIFDVILGAEDVFTGLEAAGQKTNDWRATDVEGVRPLYIWDETFVGGDGSYPGVGYSDMQFDGYTSLDVTSVGWSGAGFNVKEGAGVSTLHWSDETMFHVAYRTATTAPISVAFVIVDGAGNSPAKFAVGDAFNDGGAIYPTVGPQLSDEWQAIDISFAALKKIYPTFSYARSEQWLGNIVSFLGGGVQGQNISLDCMYFHTPENAEGGVVAVGDDAQFVVTRNTINVSGVQGIELYDLSGRLVKSTNGTTLGIDNVGSGVFVVKSGNKVVKVVK